MEDTMSEKPFALHLDGKQSKLLEGLFSWNGTASDLKEILQDTPVRASIAALDEIRGNSDISFVLLESANESSVTSSQALPPSEADPAGASSFVIAVILIYGLSIIFLIASHVFIKKRVNHKESEKQISKYLAQAPVLKDASRRESFKKLKRSLIPMIARSPSGRTMIAKRVKYTPYLIRYLPFTALGKPTKPSETVTAPIAGNGISSSDPNIPTCDRPIAIRHVGPLFQLVPFNGDVTDALVHMEMDSDDDDDFYVEDTSDENQDKMLGQYLYGGRSLEDILKAGSDAELDSPKNASSVETIV